MKLRWHALGTAPAVSLVLALGLLGSPGNPAAAAVRHRANFRVAALPGLTTSRATLPALPRKAQPLDPPWSRQNVPNVRFQHGRRAAVSCSSRTYCVTVGSTIAYAGPNSNNPPAEMPFAAIWNGSVWTPMPMPSVSGAVLSYLSGVSCIPGYLYCAAVGAYETSSGIRPLTETWNGSYWRVTPSATLQGSPKSALTAVSCTAARFCMAVGVAEGPGGEFLLDEDEEHGVWAVVPGPLLFLHTSDLVVSGLSCSSNSQCMAVGGDYSSNPGEEVTLAALWQGHDWFRVRTPTPGQGGQLRGVSCPTHSNCTAVGYYDDTPGALVPHRTLAERWDGERSWTVMTTANDGKGTDGLYAVSCRQVNACAAVGEYVGNTGVQQTLAEQLAGPSWAIKPTTDLAGSIDNELTGVSCTAVSSCTAVGDYQDPTSTFTQAQAWNGTAWHAESNARDQAVLSAVSCSAPSACTAVGYWTPSNSDQAFVLAERWNGATWSVQLLPEPGSSYAMLNGVSCPTATYCVAVGFSNDAFTDSTNTWAAEWDGTGWEWQNPPDPGNNDVLNAVSCVSSAQCVAVGYADGDAQNLAEVWRSGGWAVQATPNPAPISYLNGVSCTAVTACTAVGTESGSDGAYGIALGLSGSTWSVEDTASPVNSSLSSVSCTPSACTAVGYYSATSPLVQGYTLAEQLTAGTWTMQPTPNPGGAYTNELSSVSCTAADACTAVGTDGPQEANGNVTLAETWDGSTWAVQPTVNQPGASASQLDAVSCVASACNAAGYYDNAEQDAYPLAESQSPG
jgi:hypothetical protein